MGLADRDYTRNRPSRGGYAGSPAGVGWSLSGWRFWSITTWLIVINVAIYVLDNLVLRSALVDSVYGVSATGSVLTAPRTPLEAFGMFSTHLGFEKLEVWRLVTYQFLHANFWHLAFNMYGLYMFGRVVEAHMGRRTYAAFYLVCGIFGGLLFLSLNLSALLGLSLPGVLLVSKFTPLVGASAGVFGVAIARAYITPKDIVRLLFPPIDLDMRTLAYGFVGLAFLNLILAGDNQGGDAAHVGGAIAGYFFVRRTHLLRDFFEVSKKSEAPGKKKKSRRTPGRRGASDDEVDRILDKVQAEGIHSLSEREKKKLSEATEERRGGR